MVRYRDARETSTPGNVTGPQSSWEFRELKTLGGRLCASVEPDSLLLGSSYPKPVVESQSHSNGVDIKGT